MYYARLTNLNKIIPQSNSDNYYSTERLAKEYQKQQILKYLIKHHINTNTDNFLNILIDLKEFTFKFQIKQYLKQTHHYG